MKSIEEVIIAHLHDEASTDEVRRLFEWVCADPENAKEFARYGLLHAQLRGQLSGEQRARESGEFPTADRTKPKVTLESTGRHYHAKVGTRRFKSRFSYLLAGSLAASLLVALLGVGLKKADDRPVTQQPGTRNPFATIAQTVDATWGGERSFAKGDRVAAETLDLREGFVRLELDGGVRVTLQGPARLAMITPDRARLASGMLTATVPPGEEGFRVDTPNVEVTDLGTAFGIHVDNDGVSNVSRLRWRS